MTLGKFLTAFQNDGQRIEVYNLITLETYRTEKNNGRKDKVFECPADTTLAEHYNRIFKYKVEKFSIKNNTLTIWVR